MKITLFMPSLAGGGAEHIMLILSEKIAEMNHDVDLVVTRGKGVLSNRVPENVKLIDLKSKRIITSLPSLIRYLKDNRPDLVLSTLTPTNILMVIAIQFARIRPYLILREANALSESLNHGRKRRMLFPFLMRWAYPKANGLIAISKGVARDLRVILQGKKSNITVIYNPALIASLQSKIDEPADDRWFPGNQEPIILAAGRLTEQKDFSTLIQAFSIIRKQRRAKLIILGEGEERSSLESLVRILGLEGDVTLPGFVENPYPYMLRAQVFVLSSRWEGFGNVLVEAMACSTPIVSTNCPSGPSEILEDGRHGILVPVGDIEAMASAIMKQFDEPYSETLKSRSKDFTIDVILPNYLNVLGLTK